MQVVQTLSAGVDRFLPLMRPGMELHNASGTHDVAVAEWCMPFHLSLQPQLRSHAAAAPWVGSSDPSSGVPGMGSEWHAQMCLCLQELRCL